MRHSQNLAERRSVSYTSGRQKGRAAGKVGKTITIEELAAICRSLRIEHGMSAVELADALGVTRSYIWSAENDIGEGRPPHLRIRRRIVEYFGCCLEFVGFRLKR